MSAAPLRTPARRPAARPAPGPGSRPARQPRLRIVRTPVQARSRVPFMLTCLLVLGGAMLGSLVLNTLMATTSYRIHDLQIELAQLSQTEQELGAQVDQVSSPGQLAARAADLGMAPAEGLSFIRLGDGTITGPAEGLIEGE